MGAKDALNGTFEKMQELEPCTLQIEAYPCLRVDNIYLDHCHEWSGKLMIERDVVMWHTR